MHLDHRLLVIWVGAMVREHRRATNDNPFYTDCSTFVVIRLALLATKVVTPRSSCWIHQAPCGTVSMSTLDTRSQNVVSQDCGDNRIAAKKDGQRLGDKRACIRFLTKKLT
jgi:hypothetical protein